MASVSGITDGMMKMRITKSWEEIFSTKNLNKIAKKLGSQWKELGMQLDYEQHHFDNFGDNSYKQPKECALAMLTNYRDKSATFKTQKQIDDFIIGLKETSLYNIVEDLTEERAQAVTKTPQQCSEQPAPGPQIFISYNWGKQPQIKKLHAILAKRGYTCWMDIGQMGGGDALYAEIDKGMRGCKVVLSCVTAKYAQSDNCCKEMSLANSLRIPIIPLKLEPKMEWPPAGAMGPMLAQLLYIEFCRPSVDVQDHWESSPSFGQLLEKLEKYVRL